MRENDTTVGNTLTGTIPSGIRELTALQHCLLCEFVWEDQGNAVIKNSVLTLWICLNLAGDNAFGDVSNAIGVCDLTLEPTAAPSYSPAPTNSRSPTHAPTAFECDEVTVTIELTTDRYGEETSWELTDRSGTVQESGSGYDSSTDYEINRCVSAETCSFTIFDSVGDGICCAYGIGSYSVVRDGVRHDGVADFLRNKTISIC